VIGQTVEQATEQVDKFLDDAAMAHLRACELFMDMEPEHCEKDWATFCERIRWSQVMQQKPKNAAERRSPS